MSRHFQFILNDFRKTFVVTAIGHGATCDANATNAILIAGLTGLLILTIAHMGH